MPSCPNPNPPLLLQEERTQLRNRERAMALLRSKLFEMELEKQRAEIAQRRKSQVGGGGGAGLGWDEAGKQWGKRMLSGARARWARRRLCSIACWELACLGLILGQLLEGRDSWGLVRNYSVLCRHSALLQVGTGSRSEKIKTYNYKDTRMSGERDRF